MSAKKTTKDEGDLVTFVYILFVTFVTNKVIKNKKINYPPK